MPVMEGTIPSLLQGVSQQIPRERQPGQLGAQLNMLSDRYTVFGNHLTACRRR